MKAVELIRFGADHMREYGKVEGSRMTRDGKVCALGAIDLADGRFDMRTLCDFNFPTGRPSDEAREAHKVLSELIPVDGFTKDDPDNWLRVGTTIPERQSPATRIAWYSNTHTTEEVLAWFDHAAAVVTLREEQEQQIA